MSFRSVTLAWKYEGGWLPIWKFLRARSGLVMPPCNRALRQPNVRSNQRRDDSGSDFEKIVEVRFGGYALAPPTNVQLRGEVCGADNLQALENQGHLRAK